MFPRGTEKISKHTEGPKYSVWKRGRNLHGIKQVVRINTLDERFDDYKYVNLDLDLDTKNAALSASSFVVGLISHLRAEEEVLFRASGTIYEAGENADGKYFTTIVTSASLLGHTHDVDDIKIKVYTAGGKIFDGTIVGYDLHYNLAIVHIYPDVPMSVATLKHLDDSVAMGPSSVQASRGFIVRPNSRKFKICAGEKVVALGRECKSFDIMAAPGEYSLDDCRHDCLELMMSTCRITKPGVGGPLVNRYGEVIGLNFMHESYTPFLAVNFVEKLFRHFKRFGTFCRPSTGLMAATNLYAARLEHLEHIIRNHPEIKRGVFVEEVAKDYPADRAGLKPGDVIVQCDGKPIRGFLKFCSKMLRKGGKTVEVGFIRKGHDGLLKLNIAVEEFMPDNFNNWALPDENTYKSDMVR